MGLEKVKQEILEKAQKEASELVESADSEAKAIVKSAEKSAQELEQRELDEAEKSSEFAKKREIAAAELELQKQALSVKNELVESVFSEAGKRLAQLGEKKREAHIRMLLDAAGKELDVAVVYCSKKDVRLVEGSGKLKVFSDEKISGGIIAESQDGKLRVDYSYDTLLGQVRSKVLGDVASKLFGKQ